MPSGEESEKRLTIRLQNSPPGVAKYGYRSWVLCCCSVLLWGASCGKPIFPLDTQTATAATSAPANPPPDSPAAAAHEPADAKPARDTTSSLRSRIMVTTITFDILRVRVPQGLLSESGKIWNHVDLGFLPGATANILHRNGLKVARGDTSAWPPIKAILETEPRVETAQSRLTVHNGYPLLLDVDAIPRDQLLFVYRQDGSMAGAPWPSSRNLLRMDYGISPTDPQALLLEVVPAIKPATPSSENLRGLERWNPTAILADRTTAIRDLSFRVELAPNQFLAIGPSTTTRDLPYVMGSLLLCEEKAGEKFESIYFITPTVTRSGDS